MQSALFTPRDSDILTALDRCPLTARQLLRLSETFSYPFTSEPKVRARMQILAESGRVFRWPYLAIAGRSAPTCYTLTRKGYRLLYGIDAEPHARRAFAPVSVARQQHTYGLAEFIIRTVIAAHRDGIGVVQFGRENSVRIGRDDDQVLPDCSFTLVTPWGGEFRFYVEIDRRTERIRSDKDTDSWERKIRIYEAAQDASKERFRVLAISVASTVRPHHILETAAALASNTHRSLIYATSLETYVRCPAPLTDSCFKDHRGQAVSLLPVRAFPAAASHRAASLLAGAAV